MHTKNARKAGDQVKSGVCDYDLIEVMACPGVVLMVQGNLIHSSRASKRTAGIIIMIRAYSS